jgi:hypothetical protein
LRIVTILHIGREFDDLCFVRVLSQKLMARFRGGISPLLGELTGVAGAEKRLYPFSLFLIPLLFRIGWRSSSSWFQLCADF